MCYSVYISTDSSENLSELNSQRVKFEKLSGLNDASCTALLDFSNKWYVGSKSGCSCTFRHLTSTELGFSDPVDWYEEEQDELDATRELYATLSNLLGSGHQVDLIDSWQGARPQDMITLDVSLDEVSPTAFRLFENHKFKLKRSNKSPRRRERSRADDPCR